MLAEERAGDAPRCPASSSCPPAISPTSPGASTSGKLRREEARGRAPLPAHGQTLAGENERSVERQARGAARGAASKAAWSRCSFVCASFAGRCGSALGGDRACDNGAGSDDTHTHTHLSRAPPTLLGPTRREASLRAESFHTHLGQTPQEALISTSTWHCECNTSRGSDESGQKPDSTHGKAWQAIQCCHRLCRQMKLAACNAHLRDA